MTECPHCGARHICHVGGQDTDELFRRIVRLRAKLDQIHAWAVEARVPGLGNGTMSAAGLIKIITKDDEREEGAMDKTNYYAEIDSALVDGGDALELVRGVAGVEMRAVFEVGEGLTIPDEYALAETVHYLNEELAANGYPIQIGRPRPDPEGAP